MLPEPGLARPQLAEPAAQLVTARPDDVLVDLLDRMGGQLLRVVVLDTSGSMSGRTSWRETAACRS